MSNPPPKYSWTDEQIAEGIRKSHGMYADAARYLTRRYGRKCVRSTIWRRVEASPALQRLVQKIRDSATDFVEKRMWSRIEQGDPRMISYYLNTFGQERGYGKKDPFKLDGELKIELQQADLDA